uniref:Predicted Fe-Mo cluster-binding protein, NifX family n=1 Tax=Candidatus Kentrum sp. LPFa TaxID=2126335 RepID=A0A450WZA4_9GAMM|nr:MAG: Predicted Fe-Mo cluster-binding protein, NifX family [Candidatus Kentron sp. LPFa]VFK35166.1 MAG: Predicted Fe-Mo cluster-binding protein, NifX family [Candidatus Kentron sp. LPFa]
MKIAVTSQNRHEITGHAGRCRNFWIYGVAEDSSGDKIKDKELLELPKEQCLHEHQGASHPVLDQVRVFISGGMGQGMQRRLAGRGIRGIVTQETDPDTAIRAFLDGSLAEEESGCSDHGHGHEHGHECGCGHQAEVRFSPGVS